MIIPYIHQVKAAKTAACIGRGTISMVTGYGKSVTMALLINELQVKTLVIVPNLELKRQLTETFNKLLGPTKNVVVENIDSVFLKRDATNYDCLIIDEVHRAAAKSYHKLNKTKWKDIYYRFGFTATPYRNKDNEQLLLQSMAGDVIYKVDYNSALKDNAIVPIESYYVEVPKQLTNAIGWAQVYKHLVVNNDSRNKLISALLQRLNEQAVPTLCLVKEIAHGNLISNLTGVPFANGQDEDSRIYIEQFNSGKIKCLIGTTGILGEGIDSRPAEFVIIAGLGKAKSAFLQQIGRGVRIYPGKESCKVVLFKDASHEYCLRHYKEQCKILKEELNLVPLKLEIT